MNADDTLATLRRAESILLATTANATPGPWRWDISGDGDPTMRNEFYEPVVTAHGLSIVSYVVVDGPDQTKLELGANIIDAEKGPLLGIIRDAIRGLESEESQGMHSWEFYGLVRVTLTIATWIIDNTEGEGS